MEGFSRGFSLPEELGVSAFLFRLISCAPQGRSLLSWAPHGGFESIHGIYSGDIVVVLLLFSTVQILPVVGVCVVFPEALHPRQLGVGMCEKREFAPGRISPGGFFSISEEHRPPAVELTSGVFVLPENLFRPPRNNSKVFTVLQQVRGF